MLRCNAFCECSCTTSTLGFGFLRRSTSCIHAVVRFTKSITPRLVENMLILSVVGVGSRIANTFRFTKNTAPRLVKNILAQKIGFVMSCSRTTSTLRFAKTNAPCLEKNILTQKPSFDLVCSRITNTLSFTKNTAPRLVKNILAVVVLRQVFLFFKLHFPLRPLRQSFYFLRSRNV
jgi:hypothetical protein